AAQEAAEAQRREQERMADLLLEPFRNFIQSAQSSLADLFEEVFSGGVNSFKDLFDEAKRLAIRFASELAALLVFRPQLIFGAAGAAGATPSLAQSLGVGGIATGLNQ